MEATSIARIALAAVALSAAFPAVASDREAPSRAAEQKRPAHAVKRKHESAQRKSAVPAAKPPAPPVAQIAVPAPKAVPQAPPKPPEAKPPLYFASLRADKVNLRSGPSQNFPILWVYERRGLPVEVVATFDIWRKVRDSQGTEGWVNQQMLTGRRSVLVQGSVRDLRQDPKTGSEVVARLEPGVVAAISKCNPTWCEVRAGGYKGWVPRDQVWGLEPGEVIE